MDAGINEEMEHLQLELRVVFDFVPIEGDDVIVTDAQSGSIELEARLLLRSDADSDFAFGLDVLIQ